MPHRRPDAEPENFISTRYHGPDRQEGPPPGAWALRGVALNPEAKVAEHINW